MLENKDKWKNVGYLETAVGCVRSLIYYSEHQEECDYAFSEEKVVSEKYREFILNLSYVLDSFCCNIGGNKTKNKKTLCIMSPIIQRIYYERDKNFAHKDKEYVQTAPISLEAQIEEMKKMIGAVKAICAEVLSCEYRITYFAYDDNLRFLVNSLTQHSLVAYVRFTAASSVGFWRVYLYRHFGIKIFVPGDIYETATKLAVYVIQKNIENNTDNWKDVYENVDKAAVAFNNDILPSICHYFPLQKKIENL